MVPLDGSPASEQGLVIGAALARHAAAGLHLVTVKPPVSSVYAHGIAGDGKSAERALREGFRHYLEQQADVVRGGGGVNQVSCVVLDGLASRALAEYARTHEVDLIVMTTHGWGGLKRLWLGSVADELMRRLPCPMILMHPASAPAAIGFHRILVALESTESPGAILDAALELADPVAGTHYTLLHVIEPQVPLLLRLAGIPARTANTWVREAADAAGGRLEHLAQRLRRLGIVADARVLIGRGTGEQIVTFARRAKCDLIAVGTRGAHGVERTIFGSVADKVMRGATQMVLVVPVGPEAPPQSGARREVAALADSGRTP